MRLLKEFLSHPLSSARQWLLSHERFFAVNVTWALAFVFIIISVIQLLKSIGIL